MFLAEFHPSPSSVQPGTFHNSLRKQIPSSPRQLPQPLLHAVHLGSGPGSLLTCPAQRPGGGPNLGPGPGRPGGQAWGALPADRPLLLARRRWQSPANGRAWRPPCLRPRPQASAQLGSARTDPSQDIQCCPACQPGVSGAGLAPCWVETAPWDP